MTFVKKNSREGDAVIRRIRALLGPDSAPSSLGLLFILSLVHELGHAQDAQAPSALENQVDLKKIVEIIRDSYPEISAQLFGTQVAELSSPNTADDATFNVAAASSELTELEASGYLNRDEAQRLAHALDALDSTLVLTSTDSLTLPETLTGDLFAQASVASPEPGAPAATAAETGEKPLDIEAIEALPATGAGPLVFALGPLLAGGGAAVAAAAAASGGGSSGETAPTAGPTVVITDSVAGTANSTTGAITYTFTFSDAVSGFTTADIDVLNGTKGTFTAVSATVYSVVVTPNSGFEGNISVNVAAGVAVDAAGRGNSASQTSLQAVDTAAPVAPTFALVTDDGSSSTDGITSVGTVKVSGIEAGATWQYSTNGGSTWSAAQSASASSFTLANATYAAGAVQVRQTDLANNTTLVASSNATAITVDTTPPAPPPPPPPPVDITPPAAPSFALASDTGASASDGITSLGTINVTGIEAGATWQYSTNGGATWSTSQAASTSSFMLAANASYAAGSIQLRQTDAANNVTVTPSSNAVAITIDSIAPTIQTGMSTLGGGSQLVLSYDSTLDALHAPAPAAFVVTVNGTVNAVTTVTVSGSTVTLGLAHALLTNDSIVVSYTDPTSGNDSNATQDLAGNDAASVISGKVADGYVRGAQLYLDANGNGQAEASEILTGVVTDANGNFFRPDGLTGALIALGGFNIDTGIANTMALKAPASATMISPLTTLVQTYIESHPGASTAAANTAILTAMHLPTGSGINLSSYDPIAALAASPSSAEALAVQKVAAQVATLVQLATADPNGQSAQSAGITVIVNLVNAVSSALSAGNTVDLTSNATISTVLGSSTNVTAAEVVHATTAISGATNLGQVSAAQSGAINHTADITPPAAPTFALASDTGASTTDGITSVGTIKVTGIESGATWQYSTNGGTSWSAAQPASTTSFTLGANTTYAAGAIQVRQTDAASNVTVTPSSNTAAITVDSTAPLAPSFALATDSGTSAADGITNIATVNVSGIETGATWQYSVDGGTSWSTAQAASVTSFALPANASYAAGAIQVRQTDLANNVTATPSSNPAAITVDSIAPAAPTFALAIDNGNSSTDGITSVGTIKVTGVEAGATWQYSTNGGTSWSAAQAASVSSFTLTNATYAAGSIQVRQTDLASNTTATPSSNAAAITVATTPPAPPSPPAPAADTTPPAAPAFALASDTGASTTDRITNVGTVNVSGIESGATWQYSTNGGTSWSAAQPASTTSFTLGANTTYAAGAIQVRQTDVANNVTVTPSSNASAITVDGTAPAAPAFALATDSGTSNTDGISNVGTVNVTGIEAGATWQYSTNGGASWSAAQAASVSSFTLAANTTYTAGTIQVRQTDVANNVTATPSSNASGITVDGTPPTAPAFALATDSGTSSTDGITNIATVNVSGIEAGATWQYSVDGGTSWSAAQAASVTSFALPANASYAAGAIQVRQTDLASNVTVTPSINVAAITVDTVAAAPTFALATDSGASASDGISTVGIVNVSGVEAGATWQYSTNGGTSWSVAQAASVTSFTLTDNSTYAAGSIQLRQTDLASNTTATPSSNAAAITVDTVAPVAASLSNTATTLVLSYDSVLDTVHLPVPGNFAVLVDGIPNSVSGVAVAGTKVILTLSNSVATGQTVSVTYTDPSAGNDANAIQDLAGNDAVTVTTGKLADGYVRGAQIYIDANGNGLPEASEMLVGVLTDANGNFFLPNGVVGSIMAVGGVNIDTGIANSAIMKAPSGSTMISPMTTLVQAYIEANPSATTGTANTAILTALSLPTSSGIDLTTYDPITILKSGANADALLVQKAAVQVANVVQLAADNPVGVSAETAANSVIANLIDKVSSGGTVDLKDPTTLADALGTTSNASTADLVTANTSVKDASDLTGVAAAQSALLDTTPPAAPTLALVAASDTGVSNTDGITNATTPSLRVSFDITATDGTAAVVGNIVKVYQGATEVASIELKLEDIVSGYRDISLTGLAPNASYGLTATITDSGKPGFNVSPASTGFNLTIDTLAGSAPTLVLSADTGLSSSDGITSNGLVNISGVEAGASWEYSTNGGTSWSASQAASVTSFTLTGDGSKSVLARQTDLAGNTSSSSAALGVTLDTGVPATPTINSVAVDNIVNAAEKAAGVAVSGSAESGAQVQVVWGAASHTVTAVAGAWTANFSGNELPADGSATIVATVTDTAGNTSAAAARAISFDTATPGAPIIHAVATDNTVNIAEKASGVAVSGSAEAGASVAVTWGTNPAQFVTADGSGNWTSTFASTAVPTSGDITAVATDAAGNASTAGTRAVAFDTVAPTAPTINTVAGNDIINAAEKLAGVVVSGTAEAGSSVAISWGTSTQTAVAAGNGSWSSTFASSAVPASGSITVIAIDAAGNPSATATRAVSIDTAAPAAPVINTVALDNTVNAAEKLAGVVVSGTAEANATVNVAWGTNPAMAVTADGSGNWSRTFASADIPASGHITASATDAAGNTSAAGTRTVVIDTTAPNAPTINLVAGNDIVNAAEKAAGVSISGTAEANSTVALTWGTNPAKIAVADGSGNWSRTFAAAEIPATGNISAVATDRAGNASTATSHGVTINTAVPNTPSINNVAGDDKVDTNEQQVGVTVSGTADANVALQVLWGGAAKLINAAGDGSWSASFTASEVPADGSTTVVVIARNADGNSSIPATKTVTIATPGRGDSTAPDAPLIDTVAENDVVNAAEKAAGVVVSGTAESSATIVATWGTAVKTVQADITGAWSASFTSSDLPADGTNSISVVAKDVANNISVAGTRTATIDTAAPAAPTINAVTADNIVNAAEKTADVAVSGTAEAGASVAVTWGTGTQTVTADGSGNWTSTFASTAIPTSGDITAVATDAAGNASTVGTHTVAFDTIAPTATTINTVAGDDIVNAAEKLAGVAVSGSAEAGASIAVTWGANPTQTVTADGSGNWSHTFASADIPASGSITATATDAAGNASTAATRAVSIDTAAPTPPVINAVATDNIVNAAERAAGIVISGSAEANASVAVTWGTSTKNVTADGSGNWSSTFASADVPASGSITAVATDAAGNTSAAGTRAVSIDTAAPTAPTINMVAGNDIVNAAEKLAGVAVSGSAEAGASIAVTWGSTTQSVTAAGDGSWSSTFASAKIPASGNISAIATDAAGNASAAVMRAVSIDATAPTVPVIHSVAGNDIVNAAEKAAGVVVSGTAESNATVLATWGTAVKTVQADITGAWSASFAAGDVPADGNSSIGAIASDAAGNASSAGTRSVSIDTATPTPPVINAVATDNIVNAAERSAGVVVSGTAEANASVAVAWGSNPVRTVTADGSGNWSSTFASADVPASGNITAIATDAAGNASATVTRTVNVDTAAPAAPVIHAVATDNTVNAAEYAAGVVVSGTAEANASVSVAWGSKPALTVTADSNGNWTRSFASTDIPASGNVTAIATDAAGNASAEATRIVSVDTVAPTAPTINTVAGDDIVNVSEKAAGVVVSGSAEIGSTIALSWGAVSKSVVVGATGNWSTTFSATELPASGSTTISASLTDAAGNANAAATTRVVNVDRSAVNRDVSTMAAATVLATGADTSVDSITLASGQILNLTASQYTANSVALGKITNPVTDYVINIISGVATQSDALSLGSKANIDSITLNNGQVLSLTAAQYTANAGALSKIGNALASYTVDVTAVSGADALAIAGNPNVDHVTLLAGQTFNLTATQYNDSVTSLALGKISNPVADYNVNVNGATSVDALAIAAHSNVDHVTLQAGQSFSLSSADFTSSLTAFDKFTNAPSEYSVTVGLASGVLPTDIATLVSTGDPHSYIDTLNLADNTVTLTDAQATAMVNEGLAFAADDTGVTVHAVGTHLQTSLSDLQKLGVDVVSVAVVSGAFGIDTGTGAIDFTHLPTVSAGSGVVVGLEVSDTAFTSLNLPTHAAELHTAGFDAIMALDHTLTVDSAQVDSVHAGGLVFDTRDTITMTVSSANESTVISSLVNAIDGQTYNHDLDVIDLADGGVVLTDAQAATLVTAGLHFADGNHGVVVQAVGTHLQTSLHDLQALGVDMVYSDPSAANDLVIDLGSGTALTANGLPGFYAHANVKIVATDQQLGELASVGQFAGWANSHVDTLAVVLHDSLGTGAELTGLGVLDPAVRGGIGYTGHFELDVAFADSAVTLGMVLDAADGTADPLMTLSGAGLVSALQATGIITHIDSITHFAVADTDLNPLMNAGLLSASAGADVTVTNIDGTLDTSLAQLAAIGADHVHTTHGSLLLDAGLAHSTDSTLVQAELTQLLTSFEAAPGGITAKPVFDTADTVELKVAATFATGFHLDASLFSNLQLLGIDDVLDENGHSIK